MARPFSSAEAKHVIDQHQRILHWLEQSQTFEATRRDELRAALNAMADHRYRLLLRAIPVEELNQEGGGIRTRLLRDSGLATLEDVHDTSVRRLEAINGISAENARHIKSVAGEFAKQARAAVRIQLSADERDAASTRVVKAAAALRIGLPHLKTCDALSERHPGQIQAALKNAAPGRNGLVWTFTPRKKKEQAIAAFHELSALLDGDYGKQALPAAAALEQASTLTGDQAWQRFIEEPIPFFTLIEEVEPGLLSDGDGDYGLPRELAEEIERQPLQLDGLTCTLRRYQEWGVKYILHQEQALLGDEMGLGKTVQAIAAMVSLRNGGATHFAVICPASVLANWCKEIPRHSDLKVVQVYGPQRAEALQYWKETGGVAVTTYEGAHHLTLEDDFRMAMLTVDEAHYIKNPKAKRTATVTRLCGHADRLLFMTGTALENRVREMLRLMGLLQPEVAEQAKRMAFMAAAPQFRTAVAPVYYRRKREDVLAELPDLIESREWCPMNPAEEAAYEEAVLCNFMAARRVSWNVEDPAQCTKAARMLEIVQEAESQGRKVILISYFLDTCSRVMELLGERCLEPISGSVSPARRQESIEEFERAPAGSVLVSQILAGGTGLNIQAASVVILCEPQLKPSIESQAISRAYRMGQSRNVLVYRLLSQNSIDESICELLAEKQAAFDAFADRSALDSAQKKLELDQTSIDRIMEEEIRRIREKRGLPPAPPPEEP